jgi:hypothetical protein
LLVLSSFKKESEGVPFFWPKFLTYLYFMKQLLFLTLLFTTAQLYGQAPIHFLITSDQQINITEPLCEDMIKESEDAFIDAMEAARDPYAYRGLTRSMFH